jgi:DNA polymerase sigma
MEFKVVLGSDPSVRFEADILVNKILENYNTELLSTYVSIDSRYQELCLIMKYLNKYYFPNKMNRLNSYSIALMTLAYLQHEGILPILQSSTEKYPLEPYEVEYIKQVFKKNKGEAAKLHHSKWYRSNVAFHKIDS